MAKQGLGLPSRLCLAAQPQTDDFLRTPGVHSLPRIIRVLDLWLSSTDHLCRQETPGGGPHSTHSVSVHTPGPGGCLGDP